MTPLKGKEMTQRTRSPVRAWVTWQRAATLTLDLEIDWSGRKPFFWMEAAFGIGFMVVLRVEWPIREGDGEERQSSKPPSDSDLLDEAMWIAAQLVCPEHPEAFLAARKQEIVEAGKRQKAGMN